MSTSLYWEPIRPVNARGGWGLPLKGILARKYMDHDGSLGGEAVLTRADVPFLEGLEASGAAYKDQVRELIDAIEKHGEIRIWTSD